MAQSERGAAHTRAGGRHGSVTSTRGGGAGAGGPALLHPPSAQLRPAPLKNVTSPRRPLPPSPGPLQGPSLTRGHLLQELITLIRWLITLDTIDTPN